MPKRKIYLMPEDLLERIAEFRFSNKIESEGAAVRRLIERGLPNSPTMHKWQRVDLGGNRYLCSACGARGADPWNGVCPGSRS